MNDIEIFDSNGLGYSKIHCFGKWCVALINYADKLKTADKMRLEKHLLTDEVFLLLKGSAVLFIGEKLEEIPMEKGKVYNVKKGIWHTITLSEDARVAVVENDKTGPQNTVYYKDGNYNV